jgi:hypothetical protein
MTRFAPLKKFFGLLLFLLLFFLATALPVRAATTLNAITKQDDPGRTHLTFSLSAATDVRVDHSGQRINLTLAATSAAEGLRLLPEDGTLVRMDLSQRRADLLLEVVLRRAPLQVTSDRLADPPRLVIRIDWQEEDSSRPALALQVPDRPLRRAAGGSLTTRRSPWDGDWPAFFRDYRADLTIPLALETTPPPPPQLITAVDSPLWPLQQHASTGNFAALLESAAALPGLAGEDLYLKDLLVAEARLRSGAHAAGLALLETLRERTAAHQRRVDYLTAWGETARNNPIAGLVHLQMTLAQAPGEDPLAAAIILLHAEAALASGRYQLAHDLLTAAAFVWPEELQLPRRIRQADALAGLGQRSEALEQYRNLQPFCHISLYSCGQAAGSALAVGDFAMARRLFRRLALEVSDAAHADLIHFGAGAATYAAGDHNSGWLALEEVLQHYPNSEGGDRARLRLIDIRVIQGDKEALAAAVADYSRLGQASAHRGVREESLFKAALALFLLDDHQQSITRLMQFRRDYHSAPLRREANLLIARQLPLVVSQLLAAGKQLDALILVEQNRELLLASGYDRAFLENLVIAFERLGLYERAARVLLYLFDRTADSAEQEPLYLPLVRSYLHRDEHAAVADYVGRYLLRYPQGEDGGTLFALLLDSLARQQRHDDIRHWLERPERPASAVADIRAAEFHWQNNEFAAVVELLERAARSRPLAATERARLAEAAYQSGQLAAARHNYLSLLEDDEFAGQAAYRNAQILLDQGAHESAVSQLEELVEREEHSAWGKLARDLLIQQKRSKF